MKEENWNFIPLIRWRAFKQKWSQEILIFDTLVLQPFSAKFPHKFEQFLLERRDEFVFGSPTLGHWTFAEFIPVFTVWSTWVQVRTPRVYHYSEFPNQFICRQERPTHDMADVLLSLKNAVLKPSPEPHPCHQSNGQSSQNYGSNAYPMHHPQMLLSPASHHHHHHIHHHHHQNQTQNVSYGSAGYYDNGTSCAAQHQHYPSMSVNVSMNMQWNPNAMETQVGHTKLLNSILTDNFQIDIFA